MSSEVYIYELVNPKDAKRLYIGTTSNEQQRLRQHMRGQCPSTRDIVEDLRVSGLEPQMVRLATCPSRESAEELEAALVYYQKKKPSAAQRWRRRAQTMPRRQGATWSSAEHAMLKEAKDAGEPLHKMATVLQRSRGAIRSKLNKMDRAEA